MEPWYDYVILPAALGALGFQAAVLAIPATTLRRRLAILGMVAMIAVFLFAIVAPLTQGDVSANIGAGIIVFLLAPSILLLIKALKR